MTGKMHSILTAGLCCVLLAFATAGAVMGEPAGPAGDWWVISAGGGPASGAGAVALNATLGQPIAGPAAGETVALQAGYWIGALGSYRIFLPLALRET